MERSKIKNARLRTRSPRSAPISAAATAAKKAAAKKAVTKKTPVRTKPKSDKPVGDTPQPVAGKESGEQNPASEASESATPVKDSADPVTDVVVKKSKNKKVDKPAAANPPPAKSQSKPSSMRQKTLWD